MSERAILESLQKGVTAAVTASSTPTLPVKYLGRTFAPPANGKYLEIVHLPNNRFGDHWGDEKNHAGIFRIILHWPNDNTGAYAALDLLGSIAAYFTVGRLLQTVQICAKPDLTGVVETGSEMLYPASIRYNSFQSS